MTWQEELRKLDEDLASGKLSADDYRVRRDQILSAAVSSPDAGQVEQPSADQANTQIIQPVSPPSGVPQQPSSPPAGFPQQQSSPPAGFPQQHPGQPQWGPQSPEATQIVPPHDSSGDRTQAVSPAWQMQQGGGYPQSPPGGFPRQQPAWNAPGDSSPPWGGGDLPPIAPQGGFEWVSQGPESFEDKKSSGSGKKIIWSAVAVVVVAGIGVAVWLLFGSNGNNQAAPTTGPQSTAAAPSSALPAPPPAKAEPSSDEDALITPPGKARDGGGALTLSALKNGKLLPDPVVQALDQGGMTSGRLNTSTDGSMTIGLYSLTLPDPTSASAAAQQYGQAQQSGGLPTNGALSMQGVPVYSTGSGSQQAVYRAVYVLYSRVIIVETFGNDAAAVKNEFKTLLEQQVDHAPPTLRTS